MNLYDKKIRYLDYVERGNKIKNGGFLKVETRNKECRVQISIRGLYPTDTLQGDIYIHSKGGEQKADTILLHYGTGTYAAVWNMENIAGCGVHYAEWDGISVKLSEHRLLENVWRMWEGIGETAAVSQTSVVPSAVITVDTEPELELVPNLRLVPSPALDSLNEEPQVHLMEARMESETEECTTLEDIETSYDSTEQLESMEPVGKVLGLSEGIGEKPEVKKVRMWQPRIFENQEGTGWEAQTTIERAVELSRPKEPKPGNITIGAQKKEKTEEQPLFEEKWKQLHQIYKQVYPFGDSRAYLSIAPRDFLILTEKYQGLVSNSFLLHGYYNYGHILLGRQEEREEHIYYLGVPGVYYEREKQVALMFGFEGFEGAGETHAPGSFGYYMYRVEI